MICMTTLVVIGGLIFGTPQAEWMLDVRVEGSLTPALVQEYRDFSQPEVVVHTNDQLSFQSVGRHFNPGVEYWRGMATASFLPEDVDRALNVIRCESGGDQYAANPRSSARGLFQHLGKYWPSRVAAVGMAGADIFDVEAQFAVAAWLVYQQGGWGHWNASKACWG